MRRIDAIPVMIVGKGELWLSKDTHEFLFASDFNAALKGENVVVRPATPKEVEPWEKFKAIHMEQRKKLEVVDDNVPQLFDAVMVCTMAKWDFNLAVNALMKKGFSRANSEEAVKYCFDFLK